MATCDRRTYRPANNSLRLKRTEPIMFSIGLIAAFGLLLIYAASTLQQYWALKEFRGPWLAGLSRLWLLKANGSGKMNIAFTDVNDKYGEYSPCFWQCKHPPQALSVRSAERTHAALRQLVGILLLWKRCPTDIVSLLEMVDDSRSRSHS